MPNIPEKMPATMKVWQRRTLFGALCLIIILMAPVSHAGGLGMAPLVAVFGILGLITGRVSNIFRLRDDFLLLFTVFVFVLWAFVSSFWSPYQSNLLVSNPVKFVVGMLLFVSAIYALRRISNHHAHQRVNMLLIGACTLMIVLLAGDYLTDYSLTFMFDPPKLGEDIVRKRGDAFKNTSHSVAVLALLLPIVLTFIKQTFKNWKIWAAILYIAAISVALLSKLIAGVVAIIVILPFMIWAYRARPEVCFGLLLALSLISLIFAPIVGLFSSHIPQSFIDALPFSWEHRVRMWAYTSEKILEAPLIGHGFDAVRTFSATFSARGVEDWAVLSLHPHNFGLHIWVETGLIGVSLASLFIIFSFRTIIEFAKTSPSRAASTAGFLVAVILICNFTFGVWQDWWLATIAFTGGLNFLVRTSDD